MAEEDISQADSAAKVAEIKIEQTAQAFAKESSSIAESVRHWIDGLSWVPDHFVNAMTLITLVLGLAVVCMIVYAISKLVLIHFVKKLVKNTSNEFDDRIFGFGVFRWLSQLIPAILVFIVTPGLFADAPILRHFLHLASSLYMIVAGFLVLDSFLNAINTYFGRTEVGRRFNIGTFVQVFKLVGALVAFLLGVAVLIGKSPGALLGGVGVFASVLMLVFKDVILGFVAGVQLASNKMLKVGDWLEMPSHGADGDVEEIGLTTVKVRNFDKTVTTLPTYALISQSFKNWRGMQESDGRRIKRCIYVDTNTIQLCDEEMIERFRKFEHIGKYIDSKEQEIREYNGKIGEAVSGCRVNGRRLTNVGTFRAYILAYLKNHPDINKNMTLLVRQLAPGDKGLPIELYCFSSNKNWAAYEDIQADIFDHLYAVAPEFDLKLFQQPAGYDFQNAMRWDTQGGS